MVLVTNDLGLYEVRLISGNQKSPCLPVPSSTLLITIQADLILYVALELIL